MEAKETLNFLLKKFDLPTEPPFPAYIKFGRHRDIPKLFNELGFKRGVEIGVYKGSYSKQLLKYNPNLKLYGIDAWTSYVGYKDFDPTDLPKAYQEAVKNTRDYNCELIKGWSDDPEILSRFPDHSLDFVFIDGNHAYEYVVRDIALWSKKVRPGGIVYGHDYDDYSNSKRYKEMNVINAVNGWVNSYKIRPLFVTTNNRNKCWMYVQQ